MADFNKVILIGNLCQDPEIRDLTSKKKVTKFSIAVNRVWNGPEGEEVKEVSYFDCEAFGKVGEIIGQYFKKGRRIFVDGRLRQDRWEDKETKKTQSRIRVVVENFNFMDSKKSESIPEIAGADSSDSENESFSISDDFDVM